jgi:tyrosinase
MALSAAEDAWRSLFYNYVEPAASTRSRARAKKAPATAEQAPVPQRPFLFFRAEDQRAASSLADEFDKLAGRTSGNGHQKPPTRKQLAAVMGRFHQAAAANVSLAQAALRMFIVRWPNADVLPIPPLRAQLAALQNEHPKRFAALSRAAAAVAVTAAGEDALAYYRQDLDLSDHHLHWHNLYQFSNPTQGMQGRLFLYMHQQMLARYDTERLAVGLQPVVPLLQWNDPDSWNRAFADTTLPADSLAPWITPASSQHWVQDVADNFYIAFDENGTSPDQNDPDDVQAVVAGLQRVYDGVTAGTYPSYDAVGADLEASSSVPANLGAGPHNMGHMTLATPPNNTGQQYFVMAAPEVAMTTPVFYRWHRAIDDFGFAWQESQGPDTTTYVTPPVTQRRGSTQPGTASPDIILTPRSAITGILDPDFNLDAWGETHFGGAQFDAPTDAALNVTELVTELTTDPVVPGMSMLSIKTDWVYFLRMSNTGDADATVTVRIWLAALTLATNRRNWIEMDKFVATVPAGAKKVVCRGSWESTVIRRKSVDAPMTLADIKDEFDDTTAPSPNNTESYWCECGLPYRLLLPRGTAVGMPARFLVLLTDAQQDGTAELANAQCGSVEYCGRTDRSWPDTQEMGFPFDRPFAAADDPVFAHFNPMPNAAWRDVSIRCVDTT